MSDLPDYLSDQLIKLLLLRKYTERRSTITNRGTTALWTNVTGANMRGKFFPRGCRGFIDIIEVYCKDNGSTGGTITVYLAPHPDLGYVASATVTVPASGAADWRSASFDKMWNYDSMFIFIVGSTSNMQWGYDAGTPYDAYGSTDTGATWTHRTQRHWIRAKLKGETAADIPVSGIINTIEIPSVGSETTSAATSVASASLVKLLTVEGAGTLIEASISFLDTTTPSGTVIYELHIYVDGVYAYSVINRDLTQSSTATSGRASHGDFYQVALVGTYMNVRVPVKFTKKIEIYAKHSTGSTFNCYGVLAVNKIK